MKPFVAMLSSGTLLPPDPPSWPARVGARRAAAAGLAGVMLAASGLASAAACEARSGVRPPMVVELYTSEGCSSCPPADRWLSTLKGRGDVLALAFHVTYWNRLGWPDRFASREGTERQYELARVMGARNVYTPQVVLNGRDWRGWQGEPSALRSAAGQALAPMALTLRREGARITAEVSAADGRWGGYWAVLEDGHRSRVTAGENQGEILRHDHVVRLYRPVPAWTGSGRAFELLAPAAEPGSAQRIAFVVVDAATQRPVQALALGC